MNIPFLDLKRQYNLIKDEINDAVMDVLDSQKFILGEKVEEFEKNVARYCGAKNAIGVASGTDALLLSLKAHNISGKVLTSPFTFFATAGAIYNAGAIPQFIDIDPKTYNMSPDGLENVIKKYENVSAIIPVHLFGQSTDMDPIIEIAEEHDLTIIEDAAQSLGAEYKEKKIGSINTSCFSFFPSKNLGCLGDGGMITTNDDELAEKIRTLRVHGSKPKYYHHMIGYNSRLDAIQASVLNVKLKYLDKWTDARIKNAMNYNKYLKDLINLELPEMHVRGKHVYNQYTIKVKSDLRNNMKEFLGENGINTSIYYPLPLHLQPCFSFLRYTKGDFKNSETACNEVLSLPIFPELKKEEIKYVTDTIKNFVFN
ncbi:DegT/DnrJ/EryC1/StrS family aminotransferase [Methanobacterium ferruginis]|uniref:DegT/DnrJ/EryC1/StrS family aminotransferase n=1 Tax=Methanobacterium ferruginis TaxID=710191 RepID=UPI002573047A|nr:DegT/DnrJ/EryC1/StrS family aminotransferase [Methanobacterium ferruginis]BDZ69144.1 glutamine--scyllo-inositol aminotransferase [Methanobacterium ferruginis]